MGSKQSHGSIGFFLSGPLGLAVASSHVIPQVEKSGVAAFVTVGKTPGLMVDYENLITQHLTAQGKVPSSEAETVSRASAAVCVGWRSLIDTENDMKDLYVVHDSLLPELRGWNPLVTAVQLGLERTGVTLFRGESGPDTGPVLMQQSFDLGPGVAISEAIEKAGRSAVEILDSFLEKFMSGDVSETPQIELEASISPWRDDEDYVVDWSKSSFEIQQFVLSRGFPYQGARTSVNGTLITVTEARVSEGFPELAISSPGKVFALKNGNPVVACGSGFVEISGLRLTNGEPYTLSQFRTRFGI